MTLHVKDAGTWKAVTTPCVKVGGVWTTVQTGYVKTGGSWVTFYSARLPDAPTGWADGGQSAPYYYGGKWYLDQYFTWDSGGAWEIYERAGVDDVSGAMQVGCGSSGGAFTQTKRTIDTNTYYYWLRWTSPTSAWTTSIGPISYNVA